ncbi:MAG: UDP-N-acetylglucosamine 1-carboxyvinyltransferase [Candidatus Dependentiae bacterium ADurb.Bin331]|nr:MAG: UDP-N-acetylglucosamine 1-carboxyvinyltransferase [Candidatus Dependentiae bacterium ADurb.Bin331]
MPHAVATDMEVFLLKLQEMGHEIEIGVNGRGVTLCATKQPQAVSFATAPYPGFPTDLQAPMMAALCLAQGKSVIHETVFENRFLHVREFQKMGAQISIEGDRAKITGVEELYGTSVIATDIRSSCALVIAGLAAKGTTAITGVHHWRRGYQALEKKLMHLGAKIVMN